MEVGGCWCCKRWIRGLKGELGGQLRRGEEEEEGGMADNINASNACFCPFGVCESLAFIVLCCRSLCTHHNCCGVKLQASHLHRVLLFI